MYVFSQNQHKKKKKGGPKPFSENQQAHLLPCPLQIRAQLSKPNYLCLLELPPHMRKVAFAVRALNVETARAMDVASDPRVGLMRLVWWQEAIDKIYANKSIEHPTAQALLSVVREYKINKGWIKRSVEARINDARKEFGDTPEKIEDLEKYAEDTVSTILYMTLQAGGVNSTAADHAASHIGKENGLLLLIKSLPYHGSRNRQFSYIPIEVAAKHGLLVKHGGQSKVHLDSCDGLCEAVFEMASVANVHLQKVRDLAGTVPVEARPVLLPAVPAQVLLDSLRQVNFDVFDPKLARGIHGIPPLWYLLKLMGHLVLVSGKSRPDSEAVKLIPCASAAQDAKAPVSAGCCIHHLGLPIIDSLRGIGRSLHQFIEQEVGNSSGSPPSPHLNLPPARKGETKSSPPRHSHSNSNSGSHLHFNSDFDDDSGSLHHSSHSSPLHDTHYGGHIDYMEES